MERDNKTKDEKILTESDLRNALSSGTYSGGQTQILSRIKNYYEQCLQFYANPRHYGYVQNLVPLETIKENATKLLDDEDYIFKTQTREENEQEAFLSALMSWFKQDFFSWVNEPLCSLCQSKTSSVGMGTPTSEDLSGGAYRIELYKCFPCGIGARFPRYNNPLVLLKTRRGRCGEWANTFTMICSSIGIETRLVFDMTDHLWTEVYITSGDTGKWIHLDPCENIFDAPLVYERGWGKKLNYIFAFHKSHVADVTLRYTRSWNNVLPQRTLVTEDWLVGFITYFNFNILTGGRPYLLKWKAQEVARTLKILQNEREQLKEQLDARCESQDESIPRQSGSQAWRQSRGEMGSNRSENHEIPVKFTSESGLHDLFVFKQFLPMKYPTIQCNGNCRIENNVLMLTENKTSQKSSAWFIAPISIDSSFVTSFQFRIPNKGADGFAFVLQSDGKTALGKDGGEKGFGGIRKSLAIEFDTYENQSQFEDPNGNHVSIQSRGNAANSAHHRFSLACATSLPCQLNDGALHSVVVAFDVENSICYVQLDEKTILVFALDLRKFLFGDSPAEKMFVGFTAGTGGITQSHIITSWTVSRPK